MLGSIHSDAPPSRDNAERRTALAEILRTVRDRRGWSIRAAAEQTGLAVMTWRRLEAGLRVQRRSYHPIDKLLHVPPGTTALATEDDQRMAELLQMVTVPVVHHFDRPEPAVAPGTVEALAAMAHHVPQERPTNLELVTMLVNRLPQVQQTDAIDDLLQAALRALPDLIADTVRAAAREVADPADRAPANLT